MLVTALVPAMAVVVTGCTDSGGSGETGTLSLQVTDAPVDQAEHVWVEFGEIELKPADGASITFQPEETGRIDLLALSGGGAEALLEEVELVAGQYNWIRLHDLAVTLEKAGDTIDQPNVWVPSGAQTGLKLVSPFTVPANGSLSLTVDFDLRKAVHTIPAQPPAGPLQGYDYRLRPALRLVDTSETGAIAGSVDNAISVQGCGFSDGDDPAGAAVYVYSGHDLTTLGDVYVEDSTGNDEANSSDQLTEGSDSPVTVAPVRYNETRAEYRYRAAFLNAGDYTVAFTCDASGDDPSEPDDAPTFGPSAEVTVNAGEVTEADL
jgi:hypothetical protein